MQVSSPNAESHSSSHYLLSYRVSIYSVSEADTLSSCVSLCCFLPTLTHFHSTLFRDFSMSFTQMHFVFPPRFFHWFLLSFGVSCFSKQNFAIFAVTFPLTPSATHTHLALRQFVSAFGCAFVGVCVCVCDVSFVL